MIGIVTLALCLEEVRLQPLRTVVVDEFRGHGPDTLLAFAINAAIKARMVSAGDITRDEMAASIDAHGVTAVATKRYPVLSGIIDPETRKQRPTRSVDDPIAALVEIANNNLGHERRRVAQRRAREDAARQPASLRPLAPAQASRRDHQVPGRGRPFRDPDGYPTVVPISDREAVRWDGSPRSDPWM
jgi:hypothetical protein